MPSLNFAVDLHVSTGILVDLRPPQSFNQNVEIVKLLRNVDFLDRHIAWLAEF